MCFSARDFFIYKADCAQGWRYAMIYSFKNDYSEGAHPDILALLQQTNKEQHEGYSLDTWSIKATELLKKQIDNPQSDVHFVSGGTQANALMISAMLNPYEAVICADTGHINVHEAGAIERCGHKVLGVKSSDGKLSCNHIQSVLDIHTDEHMVKPALVYISNATETGTIYTKNELNELAGFCREKGLAICLDGARVGCALTASGNDLTLADIASCTDVFYIGGTKNGALMGEAIVVSNSRFKSDFRYHLKQNGALLSKSRLFGLQFYTLFKDGLYFRLAAHANKMAACLSDGIEEMGFGFLSRSETNQIFPVFPNTIIGGLSEKFGFYIWETTGEASSAVRLVTSWATPQEAVDRFLEELRRLA